jgi:glycosyltransferase involved in cell wall biosynthesis
MIRADYFMRDSRIVRSRKLIRKPGVSIILPTYCRGDNGLLKRAMESVLSQSFSNFELIVMDDGSTDGTADLVSSYVKADDRMIHVRHDTNCGLPALRVNEALLMVRGDICAYQFDDDMWTGNFLEKVAGALRNSPDFEVAYGLCRATYDGVERMLGGPFDYSRLLVGNYIANNTVVHRRSVFERLGGYDMHRVMRRLCDWDLWVRWGREAAFLSVDDEVVSIVDGGLADSIGQTVPFDESVVRAQMALDRNESLRPGTLKSYMIDNLDHLKHMGDLI